MKGKSQPGLSPKDRPHDEAMADLFKTDTAYALDLFRSIAKDREREELLILLRQMTQQFTTSKPA